MPKPLIAFQGKKGAYAYLACKNLYPNYKAVPCTSFKDVYEKVNRGEVRFGLVPVENSTAGRVVDVHNLMRETDLHIIREYFMPIQHCLLAPKGATLKSIKTVYSHIQALMQCDKNIAKHKLEKQASADTAGSAKWVAEQGDKDKAAIASESAAEEYDLQILQKHFEDIEHNTTRFIVVSKEPLPHSYDKGMYITTLFFKVKNIPAALYKALGGFSTNGINVLKIESYLSSEGFKSAEFYMDVEAHVDEKSMVNAMAELKFFSKNVKVLGCYPAHKYRKSI